jgi:hypothetical protein
MAAVLWKYCLQKAVERRADNATAGPPAVHLGGRVPALREPLRPALPGDRPVLPRTASVYLTQNYPSLVGLAGRRRRGEGDHGLAARKHGHEDLPRQQRPRDQPACADLVGRRLQSLRNFGSGREPQPGRPAEHRLLREPRARSEQHGLRDPADGFSALRKGGAENGTRPTPCLPEREALGGNGAHLAEGRLPPAPAIGPRPGAPRGRGAR